MEKKAQVGIGAIISVFVIALTGVILFLSVAQTAGPLTDTVTANSSETLALNGASIYIEEYRSITGVTIVNATNQSQEVPSTNYTVTNNALNPTTGALSVQVTTNSGDWNESAVYVQGTAQNLDYIDSSGGRALTDLIAVFFALAIAVVIIVPIVKQINELRT